MRRAVTILFILICSVTICSAKKWWKGDDPLVGRWQGPYGYLEFTDSLLKIVEGGERRTATIPYDRTDSTMVWRFKNGHTREYTYKFHDVSSGIMWLVDKRHRKDSLLYLREADYANMDSLKESLKGEWQTLWPVTNNPEILCFEDDSLFVFDTEGFRKSVYLYQTSPLGITYQHITENKNFGFPTFLKVLADTLYLSGWGNGPVFVKRKEKITRIPYAFNIPGTVKGLSLNRVVPYGELTKIAGRPEFLKSELSLFRTNAEFEIMGYDTRDSLELTKILDSKECEELRKKYLYTMDAKELEGISGLPFLWQDMAEMIFFAERSPVLTGQDIEQVKIDSYANYRMPFTITFYLKDTVQDRFKEYLESHKDEQLTLSIDGKIYATLLVESANSSSFSVVADLPASTKLEDVLQSFLSDAALSTWHHY